MKTANFHFKIWFLIQDCPLPLTDESLLSFYVLVVEEQGCSYECTTERLVLHFPRALKWLIWCCCGGSSDELSMVIESFSELWTTSYPC